MLVPGEYGRLTLLFRSPLHSMFYLTAACVTAIFRSGLQASCIKYWDTRFFSLITTPCSAQCPRCYLWYSGTTPLFVHNMPLVASVSPTINVATELNTMFLSPARETRPCWSLQIFAFLRGEHKACALTVSMLLPPPYPLSKFKREPDEPLTEGMSKVIPRAMALSANVML